MKIPYEKLFCPSSIVVAGASSTHQNLGHILLRHLVQVGYGGRLYAIHQTAKNILGVPVVKSIREIPGGVDYVWVGLPAEAIESFLRDCAGRVGFAQVASSGFSEIGKRELEEKLLETARAGGIRLLGPNCLGTYCPKCGLTFIDRASRESGRVAIASQSGGLATDVIRRGRVRGVRFSKVVTLGNAIDLGVNDLLEYFADDADTGVVGLYVEDVRNGGKFLDVLRKLLPRKPVVVMRGGSTSQGKRSAASHTGSMASDERLWRGACHQAGVATAETLEEFLDLLVAFQYARCAIGGRVLLMGPGGGASVLAADACERRGFELPVLKGKPQAALQELDLGPGTSLSNPIDLPVGAMARNDGRAVKEVIEAVLEHGECDIVLIHLNLQNFLSFTEHGEEILTGIVSGLGEYKGRPVEIVLALRSSGEPDLEALKYRLRPVADAAGIPVFDSIEQGLAAYEKVLSFRRLWARRLGTAALGLPVSISREGNNLSAESV